MLSVLNVTAYATLTQRLSNSHSEVLVAVCPSDER